MAPRGFRYVEFGLWVAVVSGLITVVFGILGYVIGDGLIGAKYALFIVGALLFGLGSLAIQPTPTYKDSKRISLEGPHELRFEAFIQQLPPIRGHHLPPEHRIDRSTKVFVTSLVVLAVSLVMEFWFGVRV